MKPPGKRRSGVTPGNQGRFEGYDVLDQERYWDPVTADLVKSRLRNRAGGLAFFGPREASTARTLMDDILAQHDEPKVPVLEMVDARLASGETDGWRYEDMPPDAVAWRESLSHLNADAEEVFGRRFEECSGAQRAELIEKVRGSDKWHGLYAPHVWSLWSRYACAAFYAHPWAWNEIGFGGPAYPRGYKVMRPGWREPWEAAESDAHDPVPWAQRTEAARRAHAQRTVGARGEADRQGGQTAGRAG